MNNSLSQCDRNLYFSADAKFDKLVTKIVHRIPRTKQLSKSRLEQQQ